MRVFARRERPHPGAQLTLFEAADGWRYSLWVTNLPARTPGWRGQVAYIDAAHRVHARVEDCIRTGKDTGIGHFPGHAFAFNQAWLAAALTAAALLAWLRLLALDGPLAKAEPKTLRYRILHAAARLTASGRAGRVSKSPLPGPGLKRSSPPGNGSRPCPRPPDQPQNPSRRPRKNSGARGTPGHPARQPGSPSYPSPKIKIHYAARRAVPGQRPVSVNHQG